MSRRSWTRERVISAIQTRHQGGLPLHRTWQDDRLLYNAATYYFRSWHRALAAAGLPSRSLRKWTKERVLAALRTRLEQKRPLETLWREDRGLHSAAVAYFGGWQNAKVAAGLEATPYIRWSRQSVLEAIRRRHRKGMSMTLVRREAPQLQSAAARHFGSWTEALAAAGLPPTRRIWTRESLIAAIQSHYARHAGRNRKVGNPALHCRASRRFGSWAAALAAAVINYTPPRKWNQRRVIEAIRQRFRDGRPGASVWHEDPGLGVVATRYFGGWRQALEAAGIEPKRRLWTADGSSAGCRTGASPNPVEPGTGDRRNPQTGSAGTVAQ